MYEEGDDMVAVMAEALDELDPVAAELGGLPSPSNRRTTDLVRLYLQEIGRVRLLGREEEVAEAQKVQHYMQLLEQRDQAAADGNAALGQYVALLQIHDALTAYLGYRPSLERWSKAILTAGKQAWAEQVDLSVAGLERILSEGVRAKEHMIKANLRLVVSVAKKYQNRGLELLDLIQEGILGLERAVEKFDPTKGYRFSTYAYWWIRQGITRAIATQSRAIRLPVHITENQSHQESTTQTLPGKRPYRIDRGYC